MIRENIDDIRRRMDTAALSAGRDPSQVRLVAVTKTHPAGRVREAAAAGLAVFGENYIQEARAKIAELADLNASWHFIGHLQTNKAKFAVGLFDMIHTVDSARLALEIDRQAAKVTKVQQVLIQVNIGYEDTKSGVYAGECLPLIRQLSGLSHICVRGLMTLPPFFDEPERVRPYFRQLRQLAADIRAAAVPGIFMDELSMGMTGDFEAAIQEGATLVRIGTAIFGERQ